MTEQSGAADHVDETKSASPPAIASGAGERRDRLRIASASVLIAFTTMITGVVELATTARSGSASLLARVGRVLAELGNYLPKILIGVASIAALLLIAVGIVRFWDSKRNSYERLKMEVLTIRVTAAYQKALRSSPVNPQVASHTGRLGANESTD